MGYRGYVSGYLLGPPDPPEAMSYSSANWSANVHKHFSCDLNADIDPFGLLGVSRASNHVASVFGTL